MNINATITNIFKEIGIPANLKGYGMLKTAIKESLADKTLLDGITKRLYPTVAKIHNDTPSRVERAIRHAIVVAWERGSGTMQEYYFGHSTRYGGNPTNSEFVATIVESILDRMDEEETDIERLSNLNDRM
jgi:two-component system response regulator (stage 0 sporulation protein A)